MSQLDLYVLHCASNPAAAGRRLANCKGLADALRSSGLWAGGVNLCVVRKHDPAEVTAAHPDLSVLVAQGAAVSLPHLSSAMKHAEAWEAIAKAANDDHHHHLVVEDDVAFEAAVVPAALHGALTAATDLGGTGAWVAFLSAPLAADVAGPSSPRLLRLAECFAGGNVPSIAAYALSPRAAKALGEDWLPLRGPAPAQLAQAVAQRVGTALVAAPAPLSDGSKSGEDVSTVLANNQLVFCEAYKTLRKLLEQTAANEDVDGAWKNVPDSIKTHPDVLYLKAVHDMRAHGPTEAHRDLLQAFDNMRRLGGRLDRTSALLQQLVWVCRDVAKATKTS